MSKKSFFDGLEENGKRKKRFVLPPGSAKQN